MAFLVFRGPFFSISYLVPQAEIIWDSVSLFHNSGALFVFQLQFFLLFISHLPCSECDVRSDA